MTDPDQLPALPEKVAPVQGYSRGIPWSLHLEAYDAYRKKYGPQPALIEGGCRGGFGVSELDEFVPGWRERASEIGQLRAAIATERARADSLQAENAKLKTTMVAAAEEIAAHWDAHCDAEGYGPQNLQRRLEEGIPSEYGYTAGAFAELRARADALEAALRAALKHAKANGMQGWPVFVAMERVLLEKKT